jgi:hypothetical protein
MTPESKVKQKVAYKRWYDALPPERKAELARRSAESNRRIRAARRAQEDST